MIYNLDKEKHKALVDRLQIEPVLEPYDIQIIEWLSYVSKLLLKHPKIKYFPDVASFAFFCRRGNLARLKRETFFPNYRKGRGLALHISPGNVPVNFAFSLVSGLLSGNKNIVKLPSKDFEQIEIIAEAFHNSCTAFPNMQNRYLFAKYDRDSNLTREISLFADLRIIWGGNNAVAEIKGYPSKPNCIDISFPDRYSFSVIDIEFVKNNGITEDLYEKFFNDSLLFDQNACTAPQSIFWVGKVDKNELNEIKRNFWDGFEDYVLRKNYSFPEIAVMDKLNTYQGQVFTTNDVNIERDGLIWRITSELNSRSLNEAKSSCGYFNEFEVSELKSLEEYVEKNFQTMSYLGFNKTILKEFVKSSNLKGIDRIVPIGRTLDFSFFWDGYDLISNMSRVITIL